MAGFKNKEELNELLLDSTESFLETLILDIGEENCNLQQIKIRLESFHRKVVNYRNLEK